MCGFVGFLSPSSVRTAGAGKVVWSPEQLTETATQMAAQIHERGPDDCGTWVDAQEGIALAHRRLSIIDLSPAGHQPMVSACGRFVLVYNGELYNTDDIRNEVLRERSLAFRGTSDTEVLLEGFALWGVKQTLERTNGMFAFALWDKREKTLTLGRDRMGEKPLYYGWQTNKEGGRAFFFGSQLRAFRPHPLWHPKIDQSVVVSYLRYGYVPAPRCIFEGLQQVRPGHFVVVHNDGRIHDEAYWAIEDHVTDKPWRNDADGMLKELEPLLMDAVKGRMVSDVPLGAFLSGGIDSSLIVSLMQAQSTTPVRTFSIGFEQKEYDEAPYAKAIAQHLGTDHTEMYVPVEAAADVIPSIPHIYDEPFADSSQIPTYLVSKMARQHVTVALSGDAGDELFAGYNRYAYAEKVWKALSPIPKPLQKGIALALGVPRDAQWQAISQLIPASKRPKGFVNKVAKVRSMLGAVDEGDVYKILVSQTHRPELYAVNAAEQNDWAGLLPPRVFSGWIEHMQYMDMKTYLPNDILTKVDRAAMAVSLEGRIPLLDHRLVEFSFSVPLTLKINGGATKWPLREVLSKYVPRPLFERPKSGFGIPIQAWLKGRLRDWGDDLLSDHSLQDSGLLNAKSVKALWEGYQQGKNDEVYALWTMLMLQAWYKQYYR